MEVKYSYASLLQQGPKFRWIKKDVGVFTYLSQSSGLRIA